MNVQAPGPRLRLAQTDAPELRVNEDGIWREAVIDRGVSALDQIRSDDAVIIISDVSELRAAFHVAERVYSWRARFQSIVRFDEAVPVGFDPGRREVQGLGVRRATGGREQMRARQCSLSFRRSHGQMYLSASASFNAGSLGVEQDLDAVLAHDFRDPVGHILIFASEQLRTALDDRHAAAEAPKHLPEFEADIAPAQNQQMLRQ